MDKANPAPSKLPLTREQIECISFTARTPQVGDEKYTDCVIVDADDFKIIRDQALVAIRGELQARREEDGLTWLLQNVAWGSPDTTIIKVHKLVVYRLAAINAARREQK